MSALVLVELVSVSAGPVLVPAGPVLVPAGLEQVLGPYGHSQQAA